MGWVVQASPIKFDQEKMSLAPPALKVGDRVRILDPGHGGHFKHGGTFEGLKAAWDMEDVVGTVGSIWNDAYEEPGVTVDGDNGGSWYAILSEVELL